MQTYLQQFLCKTTLANAHLISQLHCVSNIRGQCFHKNCNHMDFALKITRQTKTEIHFRRLKHEVELIKSGAFDDKIKDVWEEMQQ